MNRNLTARKLTLLAMLLTGLCCLAPAQAQEEKIEETGRTVAADEQAAPEIRNDEQPVAQDLEDLDTTAEADGEPREPGEAFRNFNPAKKISADNAVTFPVDI